MRRIEIAHFLHCAVDINGRIIACAPQFRDDALRLAERIGTYQYAPFCMRGAGGEQFGNLILNWRVGEHRQAKGRLGNQHIASDRFKGRAGRVKPPFIIPCYHHALARMFQQDLCRTQNMPSRVKAYLHPICFKPIAIRHGRAHFGAITQRHDRQRLWRCPDRSMPTARMVGMAMCHQRAFGGSRRVNPHIRWLDVNAMRMWLYPMLGGGSGNSDGPFLLPDMGRGRADVNQWPLQRFG